jgi:hypothetical protein
MPYCTESSDSPLSASPVEEYLLSRRCHWRSVWNHPPSELLSYWRTQFWLHLEGIYINLQDARLIVSKLRNSFHPTMKPANVEKQSYVSSVPTEAHGYQVSCLCNLPTLLTATRSMPWSSWHNMAKKSPTVLLTGRRVNLHRSRRDGRGTVTWGRPLKYSTVTSETTRELLDSCNVREICDWRTAKDLEQSEDVHICLQGQSQLG